MISGKELRNDGTISLDRMAREGLLEKMNRFQNKARKGAMLTSFSEQKNISSKDIVSPKALSWRGPRNSMLGRGWHT